MKKVLKVLLIAFIIILAMLFLLVKCTLDYYSGDDGIYEIVGTWKMTEKTMDRTLNIDIIKGSRAIKGYSYGIMVIYDDKGFEEQKRFRYKKGIIEIYEHGEELEVRSTLEVLNGVIYGNVYIDGTLVNVSAEKTDS